MFLSCIDVSLNIMEFLDCVGLTYLSSTSREIRRIMEERCPYENKVSFTYKCRKDQSCWLILWCSRGNRSSETQGLMDLCGKEHSIMKTRVTKGSYDLIITFATLLQERRSAIVRYILQSLLPTGTIVYQCVAPTPPAQSDRDSSLHRIPSDRIEKLRSVSNIHHVPLILNEQEITVETFVLKSTYFH